MQLTITLLKLSSGGWLLEWSQRGIGHKEWFCEDDAGALKGRLLELAGCYLENKKEEAQDALFKF